MCVIRAPKTPSAQSAHLPSPLKKKAGLKDASSYHVQFFLLSIFPALCSPPLCVQCAQLAASLDEGMLDEIDMVVRTFTPLFFLTLYFFKTYNLDLNPKP